MPLTHSQASPDCDRWMDKQTDTKSQSTCNCRTSRARCAHPAGKISNENASVCSPKQMASVGACIRVYGVSTCTFAGEQSCMQRTRCLYCAKEPKFLLIHVGDPKFPAELGRPNEGAFGGLYLTPNKINNYSPWLCCKQCLQSTLYTCVKFVCNTCTFIIGGGVYMYIVHVYELYSIYITPVQKSRPESLLQNT